MDENRERVISEAITALETGEIKSLREAAKLYGIPRTTLQRRRDGATDARTAQEHNQRLTPEQEHFLVDWIQKLDLQGRPPTHRLVREFATRIAHMGGDTRPLGKDWVHKFLKRNAGISSVVGKRIDRKRI